MGSRKIPLSGQMLLRAIEDASNEIYDHQDEIARLRNHRDDMIREGIESGLTKTSLARAADVSTETIRNIEGFRYTRDSRRRRQRNPGPERA